MGDAINLNLFPSCYNCLTWSDDGELAVAAGDSIHLQLPQWKPKWVHPLFEKEKSMPWTSAKIRTNVFTHQEWEVTWPSDRDDFSIGAEQSLSTVAALAWSPQGLGYHRRCVLSVLTSNLVLSLYEADGSRKNWSRVAIVNHALDAYFRVRAKQSKSMNLLRKTRIRAFAWCPPLKKEYDDDNDDSAQARWGEQLLVVATDDNDIVLIQVKLNDIEYSFRSRFSFNVVAHVALDQPDTKKFVMVPGPSLWADALEMKGRILHLSCGPWRRVARNDDGGNLMDGSGAMIALAYGSRLQFVNVHASLVAGSVQEVVKGQLSEAPSELFDNLNLDHVNFTGPLQWISSDTTRILLVAGYLGGRATLWFDTGAYLNQNNKSSGNIVFRQRSFREGGDGFLSMGATYHQHNEPITGIVAAGEPNIPQVYMTTLGPFSEKIALSVIGTPLEETVAITRSPWIEHMERYRQRYDIQYELGDMAIVRTWGLATYDGWLAVAFTMHPGDVLEYTTRAEESTTILFVPPAPDTVFPKPPDTSEEHLASARAEILNFILSSAHEARRHDVRSAKVIYAACMCVITSHHPDNRAEDALLTLTQQALSHLAFVFNLPVTEEISYCTGATPLPVVDTPTETMVILPAKSQSSLLGPGGWIFEECRTCFRRMNEHVGLAWHSNHTAVCENGHRWNRCGLTFLSIQEPYIAPFCSVCDTSFLGRDRGATYTVERAFMDMDMTDTPDRAPAPEERIGNNANASFSFTRGKKGKNVKNVKTEEEGNLDIDDRERKEVYDRLYDRYDICAYCGGKYQDQ